MPLLILVYSSQPPPCPTIIWFNTLIRLNACTKPVMAILKKIKQFFSYLFLKKEKAPVYANCSTCGERVYLPYLCNYCHNYYCARHRLPFNHDCKNIGEWKNRGSSSGPATEYRNGKVRVRK
jgi:predicted nucleic acid binding AN1-type Zn finger protein